MNNLGVPIEPLADTYQRIQDEKLVDSAVSISTKGFAMNDNPLSLRAGTDQYHILGFTATGDSDYWIFNTQLQFQVGPKTAPTTVLTITKQGLVFPHMPLASSAPAVARLRAVVVDTQTGVLYSL